MPNFTDDKNFKRPPCLLITDIIVHFVIQDSIVCVVCVRLSVQTFIRSRRNAGQWGRVSGATTHYMPYKTESALLSTKLHTQPHNHNCPGTLMGLSSKRRTLTNTRINMCVHQPLTSHAHPHTNKCNNSCNLQGASSNQTSGNSSNLASTHHPHTHCTTRSPQLSSALFGTRALRWNASSNCRVCHREWLNPPCLSAQMKGRISNW